MRLAEGIGGVRRIELPTFALYQRRPILLPGNLLRTGTGAAAKNDNAALRGVMSRFMGYRFASKNWRDTHFRSLLVAASIYTSPVVSVPILHCLTITFIRLISGEFNLKNDNQYPYQPGRLSDLGFQYIGANLQNQRPKHASQTTPAHI